MSFRLTYATMFNPPEAMHEHFERSLARLRGELGHTQRLFLPFHLLAWRRLVRCQPCFQSKRRLFDGRFQGTLPAELSFGGTQFPQLVGQVIGQDPPKPGKAARFAEKIRLR